MSEALDQIQLAVENGDIDDALQQLNQLLEEEQTPAAHGLRCKLLLERMDSTEHTQALAESLAWLSEHFADPSQCLELVVEVERRVKQTLSEVVNGYQDARNIKLLAQLDTLQPLAKRFPEISFTRTTLIWQYIQDEAAGVENLVKWDQYSNGSRSRFGRDHSVENEAQEQAIKAFEHVTTLVSADHEMYRQSLIPLAELHRSLKHWKRAVHWFQTAISASADSEDATYPSRRALAQDVLIHIAQYFSKLLVDGHYMTLKEMMAAYPALLDFDPISISQADWLLMNGQDDQAIEIYTILLDTECEQVPFDGVHVKEIEDIVLRFGDIIFETMGNVKPAEEKDALQILQNLLNDNPEPIVAKRQPESAALLWQQVRLKSDQIVARALCGRITILERNTEYEAARHLVETELAPKLGNDLRGYIIEHIEDLNTKLYEHDIRTTLRAADEAFSEARWLEAVELYRDIIRSRYTEPGHLTRMAVTAHAAGWSIDHVRYFLEQAALDELANMPGDVVLPLLDDLMEQQQWVLLEQIMVVYSVPDDWYGIYTGARQHYLIEQLRTVHELLAIGQGSQAESLARRLLAIDPSASDIQLGLAEALVLQKKWIGARTILTSLQVDDRHQPHIERLLAHIEAHNVKPSAGKNSQGSDQPYIHVMQSDDELWQAVIAVELSKVYLTKHLPDIMNENARFLLMLHRASQFEAQSHFTWRYFVEDHKLHLALLCRVESTTREQAVLMCQKLWDLLRYTLPLKTEGVFPYVPVQHRDRLLKLLKPIEIQSAMQILRRERVSQSTENHLYKVEPIRPYAGNLHRLLQLLQSHQEGTLLDIYFHPTELMPWENKAILRMMLRQNGQAIEEIHQTEETGEVALKTFQESVEHGSTSVTNWHMLNGLEDLSFYVRIHVASAGEVRPALSELAGLELFGASPYVVIKAYDAAELDIVQHNIAEIRGDSWGFPDAPQDLERWRHLFSLSETVTGTRLPTPGSRGIPGLDILNVRVVQMPARLSETGTVIGESVVPVQGRTLPFRISTDDRLRHTYIVGRTGTGKSTLLENMVLQDIEAGYGVAVIDPHGDLVQHILERIPAHRQHDVVLFDPSDTERPIGFNLLDVEDVFEKNIVVNDFIGLMYQIFDPKRIGVVGPRFENMVRNAMLAVMELEGGTFIEVVNLMTSTTYRKKVLNLIQDPIVKAYWEDVASDGSNWSGREMLDYVTSKFGRFNNDLIIRQIVGQAQNTLNVSDIVMDGRILLAKLSKGDVGAEISHFLGLVLIPQLLIATLRRGRVPIEQRDIFCLYVDEFQNFTTPAFATLLSEARKYGVALTMANQYISQLDDAIREAVFGNVGSLLSFCVGIKDAHFLAEEFYPVYNETDLVNLPNYHMIAKILQRGNTTAPFPIRTLANQFAPDSTTALAIAEASRRRYGRNAELVQHEIRQRFEADPVLKT